MYNPQLKAFVTAADCGSFTKAAQKLFISPTAVMKQINTLEDHLGMKLISRTNQGIKLTPAGKSVYKDALFIFDYSERAVEKARRYGEEYEKTFCVGTSILNPCKPFMDLWYKLSPLFPGYRLNIVPFEDEHTNIVAEISSLGEKFDFLTGVCDSATWLDRCGFLKLGEYKKCVAVNANHRLAKKKKIRLSDLYGENLMMVKSGTNIGIAGQIGGDYAIHLDFQISIKSGEIRSVDPISFSQSYEIIEINGKPYYKNLKREQNYDMFINIPQDLERSCSGPCDDCRRDFEDIVKKYNKSNNMKNTYEVQQ